MNVEELRALVEQLTLTVAFLCDETASLVEERVFRTPEADQSGVRGKAEQIRLSAGSLRKLLGTFH